MAWGFLLGGIVRDSEVGDSQVNAQVNTNGIWADPQFDRFKLAQAANEVGKGIIVA